MPRISIGNWFRLYKLVIDREGDEEYHYLVPVTSDDFKLPDTGSVDDLMKIKIATDCHKQLVAPFANERDFIECLNDFSNSGGRVQGDFVLLNVKTIS